MEAKEHGNKAFQAGDWKAAAEWYTTALQADPSLAAAYANRAACAINLHLWEEGLADCNAALALECPPNLRVKALWRKAVCLRHLGRSQLDWESALQEGLALDSTNDKLLDEQRRIFIRQVKTLPKEYTKSVAASNSSVSTPKPPTSTLFAQPTRPLSYSGILKLTRTKSSTAYEFWYNEVSANELIYAHKDAGVEPDTLDYIHEMVLLHPEHQDKNLEFMKALPQCSRYSLASLLADQALYKRAMATVGLSI